MVAINVALFFFMAEISAFFFLLTFLFISVSELKSFFPVNLDFYLIGGWRLTWAWHQVMNEIGAIDWLIDHLRTLSLHSNSLRSVSKFAFALTVHSAPFQIWNHFLSWWEVLQIKFLHEMWSRDCVTDRRNFLIHVVYLIFKMISLILCQTKLVLQTDNRCLLRLAQPNFIFFNR